MVAVRLPVQVNLPFSLKTGFLRQHTLRRLHQEMSICGTAYHDENEGSSKDDDRGQVTYFPNALVVHQF